jgi:hypothetical protein
VLRATGHVFVPGALERGRILREAI